jgi:SAM-dependent methyltransferase
MKVIDQLLIPNRFLKVENHLYVQIGLNSIPFQEDYINIRAAENRIYSQDQLKALPEVAKNNPHLQEWKIRRKTTKNLLNYLYPKKDITSILEIGCGNGWLSNRMAASTDCTVVGLDVNLVELKQAAKAFEASQRVHFVYGNIADDIFARNSFDVVILAAAIQYFNNLPDLFSHIFPLLRGGGEIHILDSPFYRNDQLPEARRRSSQYFASIGHWEMEKHYFHHSMDALKEFNPKVIYDPGEIKRRILRKWFVTDLSPFPWIRIPDHKK